MGKWKKLTGAARTTASAAKTMGKHTVKGIQRIDHEGQRAAGWLYNEPTTKGAQAKPAAARRPVGKAVSSGQHKDPGTTVNVYVGGRPPQQTQVRKKKKQRQNRPTGNPGIGSGFF